MPKTERGDLLGFSNILTQNSKKLNEGTFGEKNFRKKSLAVPKKKSRGDPLISPGMVCYAEKQEKPFLVQFARPNGAIWCNNVL